MHLIKYTGIYLYPKNSRETKRKSGLTRCNELKALTATLTWL